MLLGALTKGMDSVDLLSPRPNARFLKQSFDNLCENVRSMRSEGWYSGVHGGGFDTWNGNSGRDYHKCNLSTALHSITDVAAAQVEGLSLMGDL
jgi:hypothetical protein